MVQPSSAAGAQPISPAVEVVVQDAFGSTVTAATNAVTIALGENPGEGALSGTLTVSATQGVATFTNLRIDRPGSGYTLVANAAGLGGATSALFAVTLSFATVSAGVKHTCGVTAEGAVYCWGNNSDGQLGDGTTNARLGPVLVAGVGRILAAVSAGGGHSCGLTLADLAYCWGNNLFGQLGNGSPPLSRSIPSLVGDGLRLATVSAGGSHACGLTGAGDAYCWGRNVDGQLGDGTFDNRSTPGLVAGAVTFAAVDAGGNHTCGITSAHAVYCWGFNGSGQVGDGTTTTRVAPILAADGMSFATISAGVNHTCGVLAAGAV
jgi:alpha-tubulin suppressor-like RCC1 family protein